MTVSFGDDIRATVVYGVLTESTFNNVLHYHAGAGVNASESSVTTAVGTAIAAAYTGAAGLLGSDVVGQEILISKFDSVLSVWNAIGIYDFTAFVGTDGNELMPFGVAGVIRKKSVGIGRQGRLFLAGLTENEVDDQNLGAGALTGLATLASLLDNDVAVTGGDLEASWWDVQNEDTQAWDDGFIVNALVGYQRRRKPGVGI